MKERVLVSWSGGKDSAMALYETVRIDESLVGALLTTIAEGYDRISLHGVRRTLVEQQARSLGHHVEEVFISKDSSNEEYDSKMRTVLQEYKSQGVQSVVFGDVFLEDVRDYRERRLQEIGMKGMFPLWKRNTKELVQSFINLGFKAIITCIDSRTLDREFVGRLVDESLLADLPSHVDPSGENGEYHTFVFDGPIFSDFIDISVGDVIQRDQFYYCDLIPERD